MSATTTKRRLEGRVAVVTGASSGIGRALACALAEEGARLVLGGRDGEALARVAARIRTLGSAACAQVADVRREADVRGLVRLAQESFGPLDLLVNNAGVDHPGPVVHGRSEDWREMLETNALAVFVGCREAIRAMGPRGGTIVNISSLAGSEPTPGDAVYCATKHAVEAFTAALRAELGDSNVRLLVVAPGQVMTSIGRNLPHAALRELARSIELDPAIVPDFHGGHADEEFVARVLAAHPERFLAPETVARATLEALLAVPPPERIAVLPGTATNGHHPAARPRIASGARTAGVRPDRAHVDALDLPHPLHLFAFLTGSRHYHLGLRANGTPPEVDEDPLASAMDRLSEHCLSWLPTFGRVLDVGCGMGGTLELLIGRGHEAVGLDPCARTIASTNAALRGAARLYACGFLELESLLPEERFDAVILIEAVHRLPSLDGLLAAARRCLRPNGVLVAADVVLTVAEDGAAAPFHARGSLGRCARRRGFEQLHEDDLTERVTPTLFALLERVHAERVRIVARFRDTRSDIEQEVEELARQLEHLARAFEEGQLGYEEVVLRALPEEP